MNLMILRKDIMIIWRPFFKLIKNDFIYLKLTYIINRYVNIQ
jgi:hypothetical protein